MKKVYSDAASALAGLTHDGMTLMAGGLGFPVEFDGPHSRLACINLNRIEYEIGPRNPTIRFNPIWRLALLLDELSDDEWDVVKHQIPLADTIKEAQNPVIRPTVNAILWRMRTGGPWRFAPPHYGKATSIRRRFQLWRAAGIWEQVTVTLTKLRNANDVANSRGCPVSPTQYQSYAP